MDKVTYVQTIRAKVEEQLISLRLMPEKESTTKSGIRNLTDQYLSCSENDGMPRWTFSEEMLKRAYDACTATISPDAASFSELLDRSSIGSDYRSALSHMPKILKSALKNNK